MLHEYEGAPYDCSFTAKRDSRPQSDYLLAYDGNKILLDGKTLPLIARLAVDAASATYLFSIGETAFFLWEAPLAADGDLHYENIQKLREFEPHWLAFAGVTGYHLYNWYASTRFCGACGARLEPKGDERAMICPKCGLVIYPRINPAVIVGVTDGNRLLVSKYAGRGTGGFALIAGFTEIGEPLEGTVRREVFEEVGLHVKNIRFFDDQPWGFSQSLLVGFFAELDGSPEIRLDHNELAEAVWIERDQIPERDTHVSMTSKMIEAFRRGEDKK